MCGGLTPCLNLELQSCRSKEFVISVTNTSQETRAASARAFVHSLNILIKYTRMYGFDHKRTEAQFEIAWNELQQGLPKAGDSGFLLGVTDNKLLLDGIPLEAGQAEREHRDEALAAREGLDLVAVFGEERDDVADGVGRVVFERCRLHVTSPGVSGRSDRSMGVGGRRAGVIRSWGG